MNSVPKWTRHLSSSRNSVSFEILSPVLILYVFKNKYEFMYLRIMLRIYDTDYTIS